MFLLWSQSDLAAVGIRPQPFSRYQSTPDAKQTPVSHASSDGGPVTAQLHIISRVTSLTRLTSVRKTLPAVMVTIAQAIIWKGKTHTQTEPSRLALAAKVRAAATCQLSKFVSWLQLKSSSCRFIVSSEKPVVKRNAGCYQSLIKCLCVRSPLRIRRGFECTFTVITELKCWNKDMNHY